MVIRLGLEGSQPGTLPPLWLILPPSPPQALRVTPQTPSLKASPAGGPCAGRSHAGRLCPPHGGFSPTDLGQRLHAAPSAGSEARGAPAPRGAETRGNPPPAFRLPGLCRSPGIHSIPQGWPGGPAPRSRRPWPWNSGLAAPRSCRCKRRPSWRESVGATVCCLKSGGKSGLIP